ncbi:MAG: PHP domain-containing protein [Deltaproteobacteria bacterium]|nr:PHP domain-containing protein [Deltaproteobacteria bacterium]
MLRAFRCDLHIHTCLSPCAELGMYPRAIVNKAMAEHLDIIAICDHNSSENVPYVQKLALGTGLTVLPAMEINTSEEVHLLALFDRFEDLDRLQTLIYDHLPGRNNEEVFGCQAIVNDQDEVEGFNERLLIGATELALGEWIDHIHGLGGLAVASHIDRESFSVISQLGFIGEDIPFDALEVTHRTGIQGARRRYPELATRPMLTASDAHAIDDIGKGLTMIYLRGATTAELKLAFEGRMGRQIRE